VAIACIMGPTGTGKSDLALRIAERFPVEIISVDSAMVFRGMDIGTAKPDVATRALVPHHLIDILDPWEPYSAGRFRADAARLIGEIQARGRAPLLVGGTMLYFSVLWRGLAELPVADSLIRHAIEAQAAAEGWQALHRELERVDPATAARVKPSDRQRIQRALEVFRISGVPISRLRAAHENVPVGDFYRVALVPADRRLLYSHLDARLDKMLAAGLPGEVQRLRSLPRMSLDCPAMRAVGYRQIWRHLAGEIPLSEAVRLASVATHRLAKRQLTWLRSEVADFVIDPLSRDPLVELTSLFAKLGIAHGG
jgi:tRNA dimethylallyltransferase